MKKEHATSDDISAKNAQLLKANKDLYEENKDKKENL